MVGAGSVLAVGAGLARAQPQRKVGWAVLGLGGYAQGQILPNFEHCTHSELRALISGSPDKARGLADRYGLGHDRIYSYETMDRIADDPEIDVVYVITPPGTHHEFTMRALEAGKHVCCEKPMAVSARECEEMVAKAKAQGLRLQIGYRCHFENHNREAMRVCASGELGKLRSVRSDHAFTLTWRGWHSDKALGGFGAISEIGVYSIQALCYLAGEDPVEVLGTRQKLDSPLFREVEDVNHFVLTFPSGVEGVGATGYSFNANDYRVNGFRGRLDAEPATGYGGHQFRVNGEPMRVQLNNQWAEQMDHLSECVIDPSKALIAPGEMGWRDIRIIEAILESAESGASVSV